MVTTGLTRARKKRIQLYREARAIIAVAATMPWKSGSAPNYYAIAKSIGLSKKAAEKADDFWNAANGPDEGQQTEENALERAADLIELEMNA